MVQDHPGARRVAAALLVLSLAPAAADAQGTGRPSLKAPTLAASIAAAADWATTYHALANFHVREANPLLRHLDDRPAAMISLGAAIDAAAFSGWNLAVGKKHPRLAAAGLWAMTGFRAYLAIHNLRNARRAVRR